MRGFRPACIMPVVRALTVGASIIWAAGLSWMTRPADAAASPIRLCGEMPVFDDEFNDLRLGAWKLNGARWIAHTPWGGDFGDARFTDPGPGSAFSVHDGILSIAARKDAAGHWSSGMLASADTDHNGFMTMYGYFETRMKLPPGPGTWVGSWLNEDVPKGWMLPTVEIDTIEYYGQFPDKFHTTIHVWHGHSAGRDKGAAILSTVPANSLVDAFHTYGTLVTPQWVVFYLDRKEIWRSPTPPEHKRPFMFLINLALGSGWPIDKTLNPAVMQIDYARVYRPTDPQAFARCLVEHSAHS
ncbi:glycoside hydrolase family 16 protein [Nguyenibacter vanlangensis]|uniref:Glycoside hydrolase family 16 protein n=1 Tax=Nguyenibacter vanlangensis TaxID=1216886 RepID=A0A7Y7IWA7_9PROT|nr:glycoside hydrolase family 16 protein [Nguyenibacter vanlangensis]NVN11474.1 glycoside hydrolase family 16 protein [Nguyenibacter vanlangensis]